MRIARWAAALALLAVSAVTATAQDLATKSIEVPQGGHWIDYPPTGATPPSLYPATDRLVLGIAGKPGDKRPVFRAALQ
jgi:hypothetical protein